MWELIRKQTGNAKDDFLSGITVALALVPEAVAFAFVAGVHPLTGLYAAFMVGLITATFGGRPGMISGATGALAVVMIALVKEHGVEYLFATVVLAGIIQVLAGVLRLGKFVRLIPHPVMMGFVNGLAIVIFIAQLGMFKTNTGGVENWMSGNQLYIMLGLVLLTMGIMYFLPKLTKAIPSALAAILVVSLLVIFVDGIDTPNVLDFLKSKDPNATGIKGIFPPFHIPEIAWTWNTFFTILPTAAIIAAIGLIESLMTLQLVDELTDTRGNNNRECIAQGSANILSGFFSGMGGCAMIGQSMINVNSGGRGRLSGITAAVFLLLFIIFLSTYIEMIPIAALVGVMFMVVIGTFAWSSFRILNKIPITDAIVLIAVSVITVFADLAIAVISGVIISALAFAWENARRVRARKHIDEKGIKHYEIYGPVFFGSVKTFIGKFDVQNDPNEVVIDFMESRIADHSGLEAINTLTEKYKKAGKTLHLKHLSSDCRLLLRKAGNMVDIKVIESEDPHYSVMTK